jgi:predicted nucleotidyltransferase
VGSIANASLSDRERRVVKRLLRRLETEFGDGLIAVWLYGSRARGEEPRTRSDIDLLVVTRGGRDRDFRRVTELAMDAAEAEGIDPFRVSTRVADPAWIEGRREIDSFFIREVDRDKIVLAGGM